MSNEQSNSELHQYADGWIAERKGTKIPGFLKLAYPVITLGVLAYIFIYMNGEINHETRGPLVQQLNAVTGTANSFMYIVAGMIAVYAVILFAFIFGSHGKEE
jgi:hypothetical protein